MTTPKVTAVHLNGAHAFGKTTTTKITLVTGSGVVGDAHYGAQVQHQSRVAGDPTQANLGQVHLIHAELFAELGKSGHVVAPDDLGENITTQGLQLLSLPTGTVLRLGAEALVAITGLRNPCKQIEEFQSGLLGKVAYTDAQGTIVRTAGVMAVVVAGVIGERSCVFAGFAQRSRGPADRPRGCG